MIVLQQDGRYDEAAEVMRKWLRDPNRKISNDAFLRQQIAMVYILKAYKKPLSKSDSIQKANQELEIALDIVNHQQAADNNIDFYNIGATYEALGDLFDKDKCQFYTQAKESLERQMPLIKGDSYTAYGTTTPLEPLRAEVRKHLAAVEKKSLDAGCPVK